jgi:predicted RNA-binding Zn ribbon-like protein
MDVELPLRSGEGHWIWFGGRPALDLVNTRRERWRRDIETLVAPTDVAAWLVQAGLADRGIESDEEDLRAARRLRDAIDTVLAEDRPPKWAVEEIDGWLPLAAATPRLEMRSGRPVLAQGEVSVQGALAHVALDAARMLGTEERERVRVCASDTCGVRFYDHSPSGRRRWCSMARCGNVAKARRHRART